MTIITTTDSNGKSITIASTDKAVLHRASHKGYGWAIKPDTRRKHPSGLKPHTSIVVETIEPLKAGQVYMFQYTFTPES